MRAAPAWLKALALALPGAPSLAAETCIDAPYTADAGEVSAMADLVLSVVQDFPSLAKSLAEQSPRLCIDDSLYGVQAFFEPKTNRIVVFAGLDPDMQLAILLHELRHLQQFASDACPTLDMRFSDYVRLRMALEADAAAIGVYAAWKLQQAGRPGPLQHLQDWPTHDDLVTRFTAEIEATGGDDVAATAATYAQWFESEDRRAIYAFAICSNYLDALDIEKLPPGKGTVSDSIAARLCVLPDGRPYDCALPP